MRSYRNIFLVTLIIILFISILFYKFAAYGYRIDLPPSMSRFLPQDVYREETDTGIMMRYHSKDCTVLTECALVQDGWCGRVDAVNTRYLSRWKRENEKRTKEAQRQRQTCKLTTPEMLILTNFTPVCIQGQCAARFNQQ